MTAIDTLRKYEALVLTCIRYLKNDLSQAGYIHHIAVISDALVNRINKKQLHNLQVGLISMQRHHNKTEWNLLTAASIKGTMPPSCGVSTSTTLPRVSFFTQENAMWTSNTLVKLQNWNTLLWTSPSVMTERLMWGSMSMQTTWQTGGSGL